MVRTNNNLFVHSPVDGHLGYFWFLTTTNNVAINNFVHVIWFTCAQISKRSEPRNRLLGCMVCIASTSPDTVKFLRKWSNQFSILSAVIMNVFYCDTNLTCLLRFRQLSFPLFLFLTTWTAPARLATSRFGWSPHRGDLPESRWAVEGSNFRWHKPLLKETGKGRKPRASFLSCEM